MTSRRQWKKREAEPTTIRDGKSHTCCPPGKLIICDLTLHHGKVTSMSRQTLHGKVQSMGKQTLHGT